MRAFYRMTGIPSGTAYVPGSLYVSAGKNAGAKTDASGQNIAVSDSAVGPPGAGRLETLRRDTLALGTAPSEHFIDPSSCR